MINKAWREGYNAYMAGFEYDSNPYSVADEDRFNSWDNGFFAAEVDDYQDANDFEEDCYPSCAGCELIGACEVSKNCLKM